MTETLENIIVCILAGVVLIAGATVVVCGAIFGLVNRHPWPVAVVTIACIGLYFVGGNQ
jgi:uncharacterized RDD family membrane protein YckC